MLRSCSARIRSVWRGRESAHPSTNGEQAGRTSHREALAYDDSCLFVGNSVAKTFHTQNRAYQGTAISIHHMVLVLIGTLPWGLPRR